MVLFPWLNLAKIRDTVPLMSALMDTNEYNLLVFFDQLQGL